MVDALNKKTDGMAPVMLNSHLARMLPFRCESSLPLDLYNHSLAKLASKDVLPVLTPYWIAIPIDEEIALLNLDENYMLEVSVPILNLCDLMPNGFFSRLPLTAKVIGFNGFAAKENHRSIDNFPLPDFTLVTDIADNQYEILLNKEGKIELPKEGTGLFSIPSQLTFIFSEKQVSRGIGLEDCQAQGLEKNKLYIFPPEHTNQDFTMYISVSHLDANHKRIVDTVRKISVNFKEAAVYDTQAIAKMNPIEKNGSNVFAVEIDLSFGKLIDFPFPYALNVTLQTKEDITFNLTCLDHHSKDGTLGWMQHPVFPFVFTKYFGLSAKTLTMLAKKAYTQYDLICDYLKGDTFGFSRLEGYNDFLLRTEAFGRFYAMLMNELVHQRLPKNFLQNRVTTDKLAALNFSRMPVDFHDSIVLAQLQTEVVDGKFYRFYELFSHSQNTKEFLYISKTGPNQVVPSVIVDIIPQVRLSTYVASLEATDSSSQQAITKNYQSSTALNSAFLAHCIRQGVSEEKLIVPNDRTPSDRDAKSDKHWYNDPPRSR